MSAIGILFDIDGLGGGFYGAAAWRIVMNHLTASHLIGCRLKEGDTAATLAGRAREFCIALDGLSLDVSYVTGAIGAATEGGLLPPDRRFVEASRLASEPLVDFGGIDSAGRFVEDSWSRIWHDRCRDAGWGYKPKQIPKDLPPQLRAELDALMKAGTESGPKKWWRFWR